MRIGWRGGASCLAGLLLTACSTTPKHYALQIAADPLPSAWHEQAPLRQLQQGHEKKPNSDLFSLIANHNIAPWLAIWLEQALVENPALQRQLLELAETQWLASQRAADRLPSVSLTTDASRQRTASNSNSMSSYGLALSSSWELDVWGRLANAHSASEMDEAALAADVLYAQRSLVANVVKSWLSWVNAKHRVDVELQRLNSLKLNEKLVQERYLAGLGNLQDLDTARTNTEQATANIAAQQEQVAAQGRQLQSLLGSVQPIDPLPTEWPTIDFPQLQLPAATMGQRPDLIAAFQRVKSADQRSEVAYKNLLPRFTLNFDISQSRDSYRDWLSNDPAWLLLGQLTQPIFQGGRLRAELKASEMRAGQAYWAYREQLLAAWLEVKAGLSQEHSLQKQFVALQQAHQYALVSQQHFEQRYGEGLVTILDVLSAQQTTFDTQLRLLEVTQQRATNRIDLGLAMGLSMGLPINHQASASANLIAKPTPSDAIVEVASNATVSPAIVNLIGAE